MDVIDLKLKRTILEDAISTFVTQQVKRFQEDTEVNVHSIYISLDDIRTQAVADVGEQNYITVVRTKVQLDI